MKKVFARILSEILFWLGDKVSYLAHSVPQFYCVYNNLMGWSFEVQNWANNEKPWERELMKMTGLEEPYNQGWFAYEEGYPHSVSKFIENDEKRDEWLKGWIDASEYYLRWATNQSYVKE